MWPGQIFFLMMSKEPAVGSLARQRDARRERKQKDGGQGEQVTDNQNKSRFAFVYFAKGEKLT